jgi:DUF4097 and DUF4098 domain-containing protein YvlB
VRAVLRGADADDTAVELTRSRGGVTLISERRSSRPNNTTSHQFELRVPYRSDIELRSAGGEVSIEGIRGRLSGATGGGTIRLSNVAGHADLRTGGGEIHVLDSELDGEVRTGGGEVRVVNSRGSLQAITGGGGVFVDAAASSSAAARSSSPASEVFRYQTGGGDVRIAEAPWGADVTTGGGEIRIGSAGGNVHARTGGGAVAIGTVDGTVTVSTGSGAVQVGPAAGPVDVSTGTGAVDVAVAAGTGRRDVRITSGNGAVTLILPADFDGDFDIQSHGPPDGRYRIDSDFPLRIEPSDGSSARDGRLRATGRSGSGANRVHIRTSNGSVVIRRAATALNLPRPSGLASSQNIDLDAGVAPIPPTPPQSILVDHGHLDELEVWIEQTVDAALRAAGQALSEAQIGRIIGDIAIRATQIGLAEASRALSGEERTRLEREIREAVDASLKSSPPPAPTPPRR